MFEQNTQFVNLFITFQEYVFLLQNCVSLSLVLGGEITMETACIRDLFKATVIFSFCKVVSIIKMLLEGNFSMNL